MTRRPLTERLERAPWDRIVADQQLGERKPAVPVLLSHGTLDDVVPQQVGKNLAADRCRRGATVRFAGNVVPGHIATTEATSPDGSLGSPTASPAGPHPAPAEERSGPAPADVPPRA
ncbi:lipase family protein, partial [Streptomyces anulatus]